MTENEKRLKTNLNRRIKTIGCVKEIPQSQIKTNRWYQEDIMRQSACLVVNPITIYSMPSSFMARR